MGRQQEMKPYIKNSINRWVTALGMALTLGAATYGQGVSAQSPHKCMMWKAVSGDQAVYLLGSIHMGSKKMYPLPKVIEDAFSRSKTLVVEVDISKVDPSSAMTFVTEKGLYAGEDNLWKHLSPDTTKKVKNFCIKYGQEPTMIGMFKPWLASVELEVIPLQKSGMDLNLGIDKYFLDRASKAKSNKKVEQLETADFQLKLLASLPDKLADEYLNYALGQSSKSKDEDSKLEKLWVSGDAEALDKAMANPPKNLEPLMRSLREDRNPHMADIAEKHLKAKSPCFFVVGAAHLVGKEGVIALLQKRGYTVTQVESKP